MRDANGEMLLDENGEANSNGIVSLYANASASIQYRLAGGEVYEWTIRNGSGDNANKSTVSVFFGSEDSDS